MLPRILQHPYIYSISAKHARGSRSRKETIGAICAIFCELTNRLPRADSDIHREHICYRVHSNRLDAVLHTQHTRQRAF